MEAEELQTGEDVPETLETVTDSEPETEETTEETTEVETPSEDKDPAGYTKAINRKHYQMMEFTAAQAA